MKPKIDVLDGAGKIAGNAFVCERPERLAVREKE